MDELIAFLRARYDEDEAMLTEDATDNGLRFMDADGITSRFIDRFAGEDRCARGIAGKRKIVDTAEQQPGWEPAAGRDDASRHWDEAMQVTMMQVLHCLAEEFADHPGYNHKDWGPLGSGNPVPE